MSTIVTMKCDLGHTWVLPLSNTNHIVMPDRCPKCINGDNPYQTKKCGKTIQGLLRIIHSEMDWI